MSNEHEILVLPGQDVVFELVKVERFDEKIIFVGRDEVNVGDILPRLRDSKRLVKKQLESPTKLVNKPQKRKAHQMLDKAKELLKQVDKLNSEPSLQLPELPGRDYPTNLETTVKHGNVVLHWKVSLIQAQPIQPQVLRGLYDKDTTFPSWACIKALNFDFRATRVFYDAKDELVDVKRLAFEREPCNIQMSKNFDEAKLQEELGYSESYYTRWAKQHTKRLPPNIAVYVKTHVYMPQVAKLVLQPSILSWFHVRKQSCLFKRVHLISLVGLAFDHPSQPDFELLGEAPSLDELLEAYTRIWRKAFECAKYWDLPTIVATQVGNGAFKPPNLSCQEFKLGVHDKVLSNLKKAYPDIKVVQPRNVFAVIYKLDQAKLDNLLFVNSWGPHSMLGNGNCIDDSLDGKFGRCSAIAVLGWPGTNLHVRYKQI